MKDNILNSEMYKPNLDNIDMIKSKEDLENHFKSYGKQKERGSFNCHICGADGFKADGESNVWCEKCLNKELHPQIIRDKPKVGRNDLCSCGSGKKYKKCCINQ